MFGGGGKGSSFINTFEDVVIIGLSLGVQDQRRNIHRTTKAGAYGAGMPVAIAARHRDLRPQEVDFGERDGVDGDRQGPRP